MDLTEIIGKNLALLLEKRGELARVERETGIGRPIILGYKKGTKNRTLENLELIAAALKVEPWELLKPPGKEGPNVAESITKLLGIVSKFDPEKLDFAVRMVEALTKPVPEHLKMPPAFEEKKPKAKGGS